MLKDYLRETPFFTPLKMIKSYVLFGAEFVRPDSHDRGAPWLYKIYLIRKFSREQKADVFIETGTNIGETLNGCRTAFRELYSVELDETLFARSKKRFESYPEIKLHHGDSATFLREFVPQLRRRAIYWLDAHYSRGETARGDKDTPINEELETILGNWQDGSAILIDDGRYFDGHHDDYPTFEKLCEFVKKRKPELRCALQHDIIRIW